MAFTAMVGKELLQLEYSPDDQGRTILSTYVPTNVPDDASASTDISLADDSVNDAADEEEKEGFADMKTARPSMGGMLDDDGDSAPRVEEREVVQNIDKFETQNRPKESDVPVKGPTSSTPEKDSASDTGSETGSEPRRRFRDSLSHLQIEEAKATGRAQLGLAFEMLTMMKKRALKADPEAYQCLIDACGRVGDTKRATELLGKMHEDGIVADGTVYACLVSAFSADTAWKKGTSEEELPEWANSTAVEMDWSRLQKRSFLDRLIGGSAEGDQEAEDESEGNGGGTAYQKFRNFVARKQEEKRAMPKIEERGVEFFVTEGVERQIELGENLLEIVFPDISVDTDNETCPRCNFLLSDDDVVSGWAPGDSNEYTTSCPNCTQRFVPHFCVQSSSPNFVGSKGPASPLMCERLSPWVLQKEIRSVMSDREGIENLLSPAWREEEYKNAVLWWNLVLSCMRYRFPFSFLLQGSFEQNLIAPMPEDDA
jgi:pentatricopeptide repeat protein